VQRGQGRGLPPAGGNRGAPRGQRGARGEQRGEPPKLEPDDGLVTAYITVTDRNQRAVPGLTRANFEVLEDDVEQKIEAFSVESGPTSVGFIVGGDPTEFRGIAPAFLKATPWDDEYFVLVDDGHPRGGTVIQGFTTDIQKVPKIFLKGGVTADAVYVGLDYLKESANRRRLLLLFGGSLSAEGSTSGGLNPDYVVRMATREGVQVYSILTDNGDGTTFDDAGTSDIAPLTGGRGYITTAFAGTLETIAEEISRGIGVQYFIGYRTTNPAKDGKWRGIKVRLVDAPEDSGKLSVRTRSGYYADKEKKSKG
jgi:Ca-activated chloride channel homolog